MFDGTNLTIIPGVGQDTYMLGSHERSLTCRCIISSCKQIQCNWVDFPTHLKYWIQFGTVFYPCLYVSNWAHFVLMYGLFVLITVLPRHIP